MFKIFCGKVFLHWKLQLLVNFIIYCSREERVSIVRRNIEWKQLVLQTCEKNAIIGFIIRAKNNKFSPRPVR